MIILNDLKDIEVINIQIDGLTNIPLIKGDKGEKGDKGDPFRYEDFTSEQLEGLRGPQGIQGEKGEKRRLWFIKYIVNRYSYEWR